MVSRLVMIGNWKEWNPREGGDGVGIGVRPGRMVSRSKLRDTFTT